MTQQELAEKASITTAFLSYVENGTRSGSLDTYIKLTEALGISMEVLFPGEHAKGIFSTGEELLSLEGLSPADSRNVKNVVRSLRQRKKKR